MRHCRKRLGCDSMECRFLKYLSHFEAVDSETNVPYSVTLGLAEPVPQKLQLHNVLEFLL
jgi:hypothetical protein